VTETEARQPKPSSKGPAVACRLKPGPLRSLALIFATGLGTGYSPFASGTAGSVVGLVLFWYLAPPYGGWLAYAVATAILIVLAVQVSTVAEGVFGRKDDRRVVIDEVVGYLVTMMFASYGDHKLFAALAGFVLFRAFDVLKPPPANRLQSVEGGLGIVIDDLIAGVYALVALQLLLWIV
jgi:phosphatidylglycerophosphatase A